MAWGDKLAMVMQVHVKITTPIKLNLTTEKGDELISGADKETKEVHYIQLEGIHHEYTAGIRAFYDLWVMYRKRSLELKNWTVTDFDFCLKGNPPIRSVLNEDDLDN